MQLPSMSNPYTVQLLNDLHNHFPELLYNHQRFQTAADVLGYVNNIVRLTPSHSAFHYYQQQYQAFYHPQRARQIADELYMPPSAFYPPSPTYPPPAAPSPVRVRAGAAAAAAAPSLQDLLDVEEEHDFPRLNHGHASASAAIAAAGAAAPLAQDNPSASVRVTRISQFIPLSNISVSAIFNQLMQDALPANLHELLEDVPVIPTEEHLRNNTSVSRLAEDFDDNCAICQDPLLANHDIRTINHCEHMFHLDCIDTWFRRHIHCPCCRHDVREP